MIHDSAAPEEAKTPGGCMGDPNVPPSAPATIVSAPAATLTSSPLGDAGGSCSSAGFLRLPSPALIFTSARWPPPPSPAIRRC
eukprot:6243298-Pyramimonas_sp.AAC.1